MTNKINGIDVSEYFIDVVDEGGGTIDYKVLPNTERLLVEKIFEQNQQLKRLQEKNEKLKKKNKEFLNLSNRGGALLVAESTKNKKYKQALEEIREIVSGNYETLDPKAKQEIQIIINEVLNER